jgi:hypothetical protein
MHSTVVLWVPYIPTFIHSSCSAVFLHECPLVLKPIPDTANSSKKSSAKYVLIHFDPKAEKPAGTFAGIWLVTASKIPSISLCLCAC